MCHSGMYTNCRSVGIGLAYIRHEGLWACETAVVVEAVLG